MSVLVPVSMCIVVFVCPYVDVYKCWCVVVAICVVLYVNFAYIPLVVFMCLELCMPVCRCFSVFIVGSLCL